MSAFCILLDSLAAQTGFCGTSATTPSGSAAITRTKNFDAFPTCSKGPLHAPHGLTGGGERDNDATFTSRLITTCLAALLSLAVSRWPAGWSWSLL